MVRFGLLGVLAIIGLLCSQPASAADDHPTLTGEYGKEGPIAGGVGNGCAIAFQSAEHRLYLFSDGKIYGLDRTAPGTVSPVGGNFPVHISTADFCEQANIAVDNTAGSSTGNIYTLDQSGPGTRIFGFDSSGSPLPSPWPVTEPNGCSLGVAANGEILTNQGNATPGVIDSFDPSGAKTGEVTNIDGQFCRVVFDPLTRDGYLLECCSAPEPLVVRFAGDNYATNPRSPYGRAQRNRSWAVNGTAHKLYVPFGESVAVYDTTGQPPELLETLNVGGTPTAVAVDESTDDLYVTVGRGSTGRIKEYQAKPTPNVTNGIGDSLGTVNGTVEPTGGLDITSCAVEYGIGYRDPGVPYEHSVPCEPDVPYSATTEITAQLTELIGGNSYDYRIVAGNANGKTYSKNAGFYPQFVEEIETDNATEITRTEATLSASYRGNGKDTHYYFEYDPGPGDCPCTHKTAIPPGEDAGSPVGRSFVSARVGGLTHDAFYHYRPVLSTSQGSSPGPTKIFQTKNAVEVLQTDPAVPLTSFTAKLTGNWYGEGEDTHYFFEWGQGSRPYEFTTPVVDGGSAEGAQFRSVILSGLQPNFEYRFRVVAYNGNGTSHGEDKTFRTLKLPSVAYGVASHYSTTGVTVAGAVNANEVGPTTYHLEYGLDTKYGSSTPEGGSVGSDGSFHPVSEALTKLIPGATYHYRIVAKGPGGTFAGPDQTVTTVPDVPTVGDSSASDQTIESAKITAGVSPGNGPTVVLIEYGTTEDYGAHTIPGPPLPADTAEHTIVSVLSGLIPNRIYHYRVVAINFGGASQSDDRTFSTAGPPAVAGAGVSDVTRTTATISSQINPNLASTTFHVEFGPGLEYGASTAESAAVGADQSSYPASTELTGLTPGAVYHARVVGTNAAGSTFGEDIVFRTAEEPVVSPPPVPCRKGFVKTHGKCVKKRKHQRGHKKKSHHRKPAARWRT